MKKITTEVKLWDHIRPTLIGRWFRVEKAFPDGMFDSFGFLRGKTIWLEHKIGTPKYDALRASQKEFLADLLAHGVPAFTVFWHQDREKYFEGRDFAREVRPYFLRSVAGSTPRLHQ